MHVNNDFQRNSNISNIFEVIWRNSEISRVDISRKLELYRSTVSNIIGTMLENHLIMEGESGAATEKGGRKPVSLSINKNFGCVIGIELQRDEYHVAAIAFDGKPVLEINGKTPIDSSLIDKPDELFVYIVDSIIERVIPHLTQLSLKPLGISLGLPGIVDIDKGIIIRSVPFMLEKFDYKQRLGNRYGLPLFIENDAKCCAWLQCAKNRSNKDNDFLCVLARTYNGNQNIDLTQDYGKGIGVGLSIAMDGRIINGHNYAVGEYISQSWISAEKGQTGLPEAVLNTVNIYDDSYREWLKDLFETLTPMIPLLEPSEIYLHGQPNLRREFILNTIEEYIPKFNEVMNLYSSRLIIMEEDQYEIAQGAAYMFIQKLFDLHPVKENYSYSHLEWDEIFQLQQQSEETFLLHVPE